MNILLVAAEYLEEHGWVRNAYQNDHGAVCLQGAIALVGTSPDQMMMARIALRQECLAQYNIGPISVNDRILKDKYEAVDLLKRAAKRLEPSFTEDA